MKKSAVFVFAFAVLFAATGHAALFVNTNVASLRAQKNLSQTQASLQKSFERLSSGYRINSASDDAAGIAISEKLKEAMDALDRSSRTVADGISLLQTSEEILADTETILIRARDLRAVGEDEALSAEIEKHLGRIAKDRESLAAYAAKIDETAQQALADAERALPEEDQPGEEGKRRGDGRGRIGRER